MLNLTLSTTNQKFMKMEGRDAGSIIINKELSFY